jgi:hypothetical protein
VDRLKKATGSWSGSRGLETIGDMTEISERAVVRRLNDRLGFGPAPGDLEAGVEATVRRLLGPAKDAAAAAVPAPTGLETPGTVKKKDQDKDAKKAANKQRVAQERKLTIWWLDRMVVSRTAVERLTWFWHGHFATSNQKVRNAASGDPAGDGQAEACTFAMRAVDQALEDPLPSFRRYAGTVVLHQYSGRVNGDADRPSTCLAGVVDEIGEDLGQPLRVRGDDGRSVDLDLQVGCHQADASGLRLGEVVEVDLREVQLKAGVDPAQLQQVGDQRACAARFPNQKKFELTAPVGRGPGAQLDQSLRGRLQTGDRSTQFVRGVGDELTHPVLRTPCSTLGALERIEHLVERGRRTPELGVGTIRLQPAAAPTGRDRPRQPGHRIERRQREAHPYHQSQGSDQDRQSAGDQQHGTKS